MQRYNIHGTKIGGSALLASNVQKDKYTQGSIDIVSIANDELLAAWISNLQILNYQRFDQLTRPIGNPTYVDPAYEAAKPIPSVGIRTSGNNTCSFYISWMDDSKKRQSIRIFNATPPTLDHPLPPLQKSIGGQLFNYVVPEDTFSDADRSLSYKATLVGGAALPSWLKFDTNSRTFSGLTPYKNTTVSISVVADDQCQHPPVTSNFNLQVEYRVPYLVNPIPNQHYQHGIPWSYSIPSNTFAPEYAIFKYRATNGGGVLPTWMQFDETNAVFTTQTALAKESLGLYPLKVTAIDGAGAQASSVFNFSVTNLPPVLKQAIPEFIYKHGLPYDYTFSSDIFVDPDGDALLYTAKQSSGEELPAWLNFRADIRRFYGIPHRQDLGVTTVQLTADDNWGGIAKDNFSIIVSNKPPYLAIPTQNFVYQHRTVFDYTFPIDTFIDPDGDTLLYTARQSDGSSLPSWLIFDASERRFFGTPTRYDLGVTQVQLLADDNWGGIASDNFNITVANQPPQLVIPIVDQVYVHGAPYDYTFPEGTFIDLDQDPLFYSAEGMPSWLYFNNVARNFYGWPNVTGISSIKIQADDHWGGLASNTFRLSVDNRPPYLSGEVPTQTAYAIERYKYTFPSDLFIDPDHSPLFYTASALDDSPLPRWLSFVANARLFDGKPSFWDLGTYSIKIRAKDSFAFADRDAVFNLRVNLFPDWLTTIIIAGSAVTSIAGGVLGFFAVKKCCPSKCCRSNTNEERKSLLSTPSINSTENKEDSIKDLHHINASVSPPPYATSFTTNADSTKGTTFLDRHQSALSTGSTSTSQAMPAPSLSASVSNHTEPLRDVSATAFN